MEKNKKNRISTPVVILLTILMSLLAAACGNDKDVTEPAAAEKAEPAETQETSEE